MSEHRTRHVDPYAGGENSAGSPLERFVTLDDDAEIRLTVIPRGESGELKVSIRAYKGRSYVDIRHWFTDKETGIMKPGRGVTVRVRELPQVLSALDAASERIRDDGMVRTHPRELDPL